MTASARVRQMDVTRAIRGFVNAGQQIGTVTIAPDGKIVILPMGATHIPESNPWDSDDEEA